jgi:molybdopterin converting factor small subunit
MRIAVRYMAQVKLAAGVASEQVEVDEPCSVQDFVTRLAARGGPELAKLLLDPSGRVQPTILVFVGEDQVRPEDPRTLRDGDVVTVLPPIAGG